MPSVCGAGKGLIFRGISRAEGQSRPNPCGNFLPPHKPASIESVARKPAYGGGKKLPHRREIDSAVATTREEDSARHHRLPPGRGPGSEGQFSIRSVWAEGENLVPTRPFAEVVLKRSQESRQLIRLMRTKSSTSPIHLMNTPSTGQPRNPFTWR